MRLWNALLRDETGFVLSSEVALVGTLGVLGATVGLSAAASAVNDELAEMAFAFRSLDQSYSYQGTSSGSAWTAGSAYQQPPVEESLARLREKIAADQERMEQRLEQMRQAPEAAVERSEERKIEPRVVEPRQVEPRASERRAPERDLERRDRER